MEAFPLWVQQVAFQLWAHTCGQKSDKVAAMLNSGAYRDELNLAPEDYGPVDIRGRTIRKWALSQGWAERHAEAMRTLIPGMYGRVLNELFTASIPAMEYVHDLVRGEVPMETMVDVQAARVRLVAAQDIMSRTGHMPFVRNKDNSATPAPRLDHSREIADKSIEELREMAWAEIEIKGVAVESQE